MMIKEKVKVSYDRCAAVYDTDTAMQRHLAGKLADAIRRDKVKLSRILDIGSGTGYLTSSLRARRAFWRAKQSPRNDVLVGCDVSFGMLNCARKKFSSYCCHYTQADAAKLPFKNGFFQTVVSSAAYQWVPDLEKAFKEAARVLKPGGRFYFTIFNRNTLWQLQRVCEEVGIIRPASSDFVAKDALEDVLKAAGFKMVGGIEVFRYKKYYRDLRHLLTSLKKSGANTAQNKLITGLGWRGILRRQEVLYAARFGTKRGLPATYEAFLVRATREGTLSHD